MMFLRQITGMYVSMPVLMHMLAQVCDMEVGELVHVIADAHIYDRHVPMIEELISQQSRFRHRSSG